MGSYPEGGLTCLKIKEPLFLNYWYIFGVIGIFGIFIIIINFGITGIISTG